jgi:hypothetical protein
MKLQEAGLLLTFLLGIWNLVCNFRNNKRTTFINTVTSERIKWIQNTRDVISTLCGRSYYWLMTQDEISQEESNDVRKEIDKLRMLVKLQLNPKSDKDAKIISLIDEMPQYTDKQHEEKMKLLLSKIVEESQSLLKDEWDKVRDEAVYGDLREKDKFYKL